MTRKEFLTLSATATPSVMLSGTGLLTKRAGKHDYSDAFGLARSLVTEHQYHPRIEGKIPNGLKGTLYRNGPGRFERDGYRKSNILDGDGMVQAFRIIDGKVDYRNRFIRTSKWLEEEAAEKYLYRTWTTRRPGGSFRNAFMQGKLGNQAGVTVKVINGRLFAFDESNLPYELDPRTLETLKQDIDFGVHFENVNTLFAAHSKVDPVTGEWIQFGLENGPKSSIQLSVFDQNLKASRSRRYTLPIGTYMHDFFITKNHIMFNLQPAVMNPFGFIAGLESFAESLRWKQDQGSIFMVVDRGLKKEPRFFNTNSVFMWHSLNAFDSGDEIIAYFSGYDNPDHFIGEHAQTYAIMSENAHPSTMPEPAYPGSIRQVRINMKTNSIQSEFIANDPDLSYEFPVMDDRRLSSKHNIGYFARGRVNGAFHHEIARIDLDTGATKSFDFGKHSYVGEPIFAARNTTIDEGWLLSLVYDEQADKSYVAILDTKSITDGPVAKIHLDHHSPMSFHGTWEPSS